MPHPDTNIILIGMPGSGKSTVGVVLAKRISRNFVDTDVVIQTAIGRTLQSVVDNEGYLELRKIEEKILVGLSCRGHVIATGGSAVYSDAAMTHLKRNGLAVFLDVRLATLKARVRDYTTRGLAKRPDQTIDDLFAERFALYTRYADLTVHCDALTHEEVCKQIEDLLAAPPSPLTRTM
ncbi:shikimate kinase [Geomonas sp. RF6]|uniref:shikimate kinase n=1 Tax=Geomonas sp. RF6 TaxID=2897342 RepID=UPI001E4A3B19|nr:shikimate kinase [Geomonas sp. RF6]UFS70156.1 shikimate kinase [Geomonas sp. RF6]